MAYAKTFKRNYASMEKSNSGSSDNSTNSFANNFSIDLGKKKQVSVRQFNKINLVDIREFYVDKSGETRPGKKGISLTEESWNILMANQSKIQAELDKLAGRTEGTKMNTLREIEAIPVDAKVLPPIKKPKFNKDEEKVSEEKEKPTKKSKKIEESESDSDFDEDINDLVKELDSD